MSKKTLWVLVVLLAALGGAMWLNGRQASAPSGKTAVGGGALLPGVDLNALRSIVFEDESSTTHLERVEGIWCVAEQDSYPADFSRLRVLVQTLDGMKTGPVVEEGTNHLAEYGLAAGDGPEPLRITLEDEKGATILSLGKMREPRGGEQPWGPAPGRYVRVNEGPVLLLKEDVRMAQADPDQWWDRLLLEVAPESIRKVEVSFGDDSVAVERSTNGAFSLVGATGGEEVDAAAADRLFGALRNLRAEKILASAEGQDAAFTNETRFTAQATGATYVIQMGEARPDEGGGRPMKVEVTVAADAAQDQQALAVALTQKLTGRTFLIPAYLAEPLGLKRADLVRKSEPVPETPPVPAEAPLAESAAS